MEPIKLQQLGHKLYKKGWHKIPVLITKYLHFRYNCDISYVTPIGKGTTLGHGGIGVVINTKSIIGRNIILAQNVTIAGKDGGAPIIGDWCYVGANSVVMGGGENWERRYDRCSVSCE